MMHKKCEYNYFNITMGFINRWIQLILLIYSIYTIKQGMTRSNLYPTTLWLFYTLKTVSFLYFFLSLTQVASRQSIRVEKSCYAQVSLEEAQQGEGILVNIIYSSWWSMFYENVSPLFLHLVIIYSNISLLVTQKVNFPFSRPIEAKRH